MSDPAFDAGNAVLEFHDVVKRFGDVHAVDGVSFSIHPSEVFTLLGPSGCGKTTTLRLIAGLEEPDDGEILLNGRCVAAPRQGVFVVPDERRLGMVFQSYAIWPHMTVFENVAFPLRVRKERGSEIGRRVAEALELVGLNGLEGRGATELSGGQQQRVALARALVYTPTLLLLDEPLSNLDAKLREQMRFELRALQQRLKLSVLYVTHDQAEAMTMSDRIAVVQSGRFEQVGPPSEIYEKPATPFVGEFLGRMVMLEGILELDTTRSRVMLGDGGELTISELSWDGFQNGQSVRVLSRPEDIDILATPERARNYLLAQIEGVAYLGDHLEYNVRVGSQRFLIPANKRNSFSAGSAVVLKFAAEHLRVLHR